MALIIEHMTNEQITAASWLFAEFMEVDIIAATSEDVPRTSFSDNPFKTFAECAAFCEKQNNTRRYLEIDKKVFFPIHYRGEMKYHISWNWQIPVYSKFMHLFKDLAAKNDDAYANYNKLIEDYGNAVFNNDAMAGFKFILENLKWYNKQMQL